MKTSMEEKNMVYEIVAPIAVLSQKGDYSKELNLVSYRGREPKFDIRAWKRTEYEEMPLKGITLTAQELTALRSAIDELE